MMNLKQRQKLILFSMGIGTNLTYIILIFVMIDAYNPSSLDKIYYTFFPLIGLSMIISYFIMKQFGKNKFDMVKAILFTAMAHSLSIIALILALIFLQN
jgi:hypothetical protein